MAVTTSDQAVTAYLDNLLCDFNLDMPAEASPSTSTDTVTSTRSAWHPQDSVDVTRRMVPLLDPFALMGLPTGQQATSSERHLLWLGVHELLPVVYQLPPSQLKQYCLRQCQTLIQQAMSN